MTELCIEAGLFECAFQVTAGISMGLGIGALAVIILAAMLR